VAIEAEPLGMLEPLPPKDQWPARHQAVDVVAVADSQLGHCIGQIPFQHWVLEVTQITCNSGVNQHSGSVWVLSVGISIVPKAFICCFLLNPGQSKYFPRIFFTRKQVFVD